MASSDGMDYRVAVTLFTHHRPPATAGRSPAARHLALIALMVLFAPALGRAQTLHVTGEARHTWLVRVEDSGDQEARLVVLHRQNDEPPTDVHPVTQLPGTVQPGGVAAGAGALWLVHPDGAVQSIALRMGEDGRVGYSRAHFTTSLPAAVQVRSLAVGTHGQWALVRVEDLATLEQIDMPQPAPPALPPSWPLRFDFGDPPPDTSDAVSSGDADPEPEAIAPRDEGPQTPRDETPPPAVPDPDAAGPDTEPLSVAVDRLLVRQQDRWQPVPLPEDWVHDAPGYLVLLEARDPMPVLVNMVTPDEAWVYSWQGESPPPAQDDVTSDQEVTSWSRRAYSLAPVEAPTRIQPLAVAGQLLLGYQVTPPLASPSASGNDAPALEPAAPGPPREGSAFESGELPRPADAAMPDPEPASDAHAESQVHVQVVVLRDGRVDSIGVLALPGPADASWSLAPSGQGAALFVPDPEGVATWTRLTLRGEVDVPPTPLTVEPVGILSAGPGRLLMVGVLAVAMLLLLALWRREPEWSQLRLPETVEVADLARRFAAFVIDAAPCAVLAAWWFEIPADQWEDLWPGAARHWPEVVPGLVAIALYVGHTLLTELFTARSLGKMTVGIHVTTLDGQPPNAWQIIARGLLKAFDIIALLLLILPVVSPYRQRLGDFVARTTVVAYRAPEQEGEA